MGPRGPEGTSGAGKGGALAWLQRLWRSKGATAGREADDPRGVLEVEGALAELETRICEALALPGAAGEGSWISAGSPPVNVFGKALVSEVVHGAGNAVALATGTTLAGLRSSAFLHGGELAGAHAYLEGAAARLAPLLVHAAMGSAGHRGYHAVADAGCFQVLASTGQQALDLCLVARRLAERALCPGLVVTDGAALETVQIPDPELIRSYLGAPGDATPVASEAQRILFGSERRRLLPWFDPDRPVASGGAGGLGEGAWGRRLFFGEPVADLAREAMEDLSRLTGRPLSFLDEHCMEDAEVVLVGQGVVARCARAVADELRRRGRKVGVVGIPWLRPFPADELVRALAGCERVAVVEALDQGSGGAPLFREVAAAAGSGAAWTSAICAGAGPVPKALAGLCERMAASEPPRRVDLEAPRAALPGDEFPRREALIQQVGNAFPALRGGEARVVEGVGCTPPGGRSAGLVGLESELPPDAGEQLAGAVALAGESCVRGSATSPRPDLFEARVRWAPEDFSDPGPRAPVSALLVCGDAPRVLGAPLAALERGGLLLLATARSAEEVGASLPVAWRRAIAARELRAYAVDAGLQAGLEALRGCLEGRTEELAEGGRLHQVPLRAAAAEPAFSEDALPAVVHRIPSARQAHDSLPRFWGEVLQPAQAGAEPGLPDPLTASGVVPAGASALAPDAGAPTLPLLDSHACTGCGRCWTACPDSAIGVTALGGEALFTAASRRAGCEGSAADAMRRSHKHLAARIAKGASGRFDEAACREAWAWLAGRLDLSDAERPAYEAAFEATLAGVLAFEPVLCDPFFAEPERETLGSGELLVLAFDPRSCLGCGLCAAVCPEDALTMKPCGDADREGHRRRWQGWEALPDTRGETVERSAHYDVLGPLAALLLSRHCGLAQLGSGEGEPASGERLACRWLAALLERQGQRWAGGLLRSLDEARARLEESARTGLGATLAEAELSTLAEALEGVERDRADLSALGERLDAMGSRVAIDRGAVLRRMRLAAELEATRERIARGEDGLGRARFGVLVAGGRAEQWAAAAPRHPWYAPLTFEPGAGGAEVARGLARGLAADHVASIRLLRRAELALESSPERRERLAAIESLRWEDLSDEERAGCTPLLVLGDAELLEGKGFEGLARLLDSDLPVKILLLDGRGGDAGGLEPGLAAMAHRRAFVLSTSLAHPDHFAWGVADVLAWSGPALIHVHTPSPGRHGFAADATLERARLAVEARAHLLLRYDPAAEGHFGLRISLEGNPAPEEDWGAASYAEWAAGEERFARGFEEAGPEQAEAPSLEEWLALSEESRGGRLPVVEVRGRRLVVGEALAARCAERLTLWRTLQELAGVRSPFTEPIRAGLSKEREAEEASRLAALEARHAAEMAELRGAVEQESRERLVERLLVLSGFGGDPSGKGRGETGDGGGP